MRKPKIVKVRVRGTSDDVALVCSVLESQFAIAHDSNNVSRARFVDRYVEIVLDGYKLVNVDTGEILE